MMQNKELAKNLYLLNLALLFTHEIDSAYWQEWKMFNLPGDIQFFLFLNLLLLLAALVGFQQMLLGTRSGDVLSLVVAASGVFAFSIHSYFLLMGRPEFTLPFSIIIIVSLLPVSVMQAYYTIGGWHAHAAARTELS